MTAAGRRLRDTALPVAHELADLADAVTLPAFHTRPDVERKADGTPVTAADRRAERVMRRAIRQRFPDHAVLGEEDGHHGSDHAPTWVLDPIDGTRNFARGVPVFATLIALTVDGEGVVGVVSAPALGSRWDGVAGGPARADGAEIRVSDVDRLSDAWVSFGGLNHFGAQRSLDVVARLTARTARQRGFGDFWQHLLVAAGAIDLALDAVVSRWDLAAPKVIVEAAGGRLTSLDGEDSDAAGSALTSNGRLHEDALAAIRGS
ncbi:MAG TPA: inositol monophosphatase family protein [Nitriliruptorales bacterium]|nr:inositol monophosphatase family protein [Nitriliruptorales bacterium]